MTTRIKRYILLLVMTVLTAGSILLFPRIIINEDMTRYLPDDSRMKEGVDILKRYFPDVDMNAYYVKAMFAGVEDTDARGRELLSVEGVDGITAESEKDGFILYQLSVREGADPKATAARIREAYGDRVVVEHNANSIMPDNMVLILIIGVVVVFGILFLMCSSIMEALLFIVSIGMSVIMNMGTNAFLPSVSMMTNTIVAVLQLVLSMDYSIILMNRFRQVSSTEADIDRAMSLALKSASPSIIGSSLTTIVGLLVLVFMKFRIGTDLGLVLAKGVFFSLVSIYTILPTLILIFYKAVRKTEKRVFLMPTDALARFELKARIPLAIVFLAIFSSSFFLSKRTELSYASIWESRINEVFPPQNSFSLLYRTEDEDRTIVLTDTLSSDPKVLMAIGYPSLFKKELTAHQMCGNIKSILAILPNLPGAEKQDIAFDTSFLTAENISFLYYAMTHPERDEKMSFEDMIALASEASAEGLLPEGMDVESMIARFTPPEEEVVGAEFGTGDSPVPSANDHLVPADSGTAVQNDSLIAEKTEQMEPRQSLADIAKPEVDESGEDPYKLHGKYKFTKEDLHKPMNTLEMAEYLGFSKSQASAAYTMARKRNGTMTPDEFIDYMIEKVLGSKLLSRMISAKQAEGLYYIREQMDAVLSAPEEVPALAEELTPDTSDPTLQESMEAGNDHEAGAVDDRQIPDGMADGFPPDWEQKVKIPDSVPTPMERLAMMYSSGRKYSSKQICCALHDAGIDVVDQAAIDLMFMYYGSRKNPQDTTRASMDAIIDFLSTTVARDGTYSAFLPDSVRTMLGGIREMVDDNMKMIRNEDWSMEPIVTEYPLESGETFDFVENIIGRCSEQLGEGNFYLIGESVMYKEMKDGFRRELLFLTLLTVISIFLIVAFCFKSVIIPSILVMTVLTGVFANVFFSGLGGNTMLYLAYLIVQSILMGSTIDYGILYTNYYLGFRREGNDRGEALKLAYRGSIHTIMTSGLIIVFAPFIMSLLLTDPTICSILSSLTFGALVVICLILLVLPSLLAVADPLIVRKGHSWKK